MSLIHTEFYSGALAGQSHFYAVLPNDLPPFPENPHFRRPAKTLILLHGYSGCESDWITGSSIRELAAAYNLAVLMPAAGNSFYLNRESTGERYADFVGQELPEFAEKTFGLDISRENTWIGGLSMGGFGALHTGLQFADRFSKIMALSSALIIHELPDMDPKQGNPMANYAYYNHVFGDLKTAPERSCNPEVLLRQLQEAGKPFPTFSWPAERRISCMSQTAPSTASWRNGTFPTFTALLPVSTTGNSGKPIWSLRSAGCWEWSEAHEHTFLYKPIRQNSDLWPHLV